MATAQEFLKVALAEVGNGPGKYNTGGQPWCAIFVNWCLKQVNYGKYGTAAAVSFADFGSRHKPGDGYTPKGGDLLMVGYTGQWAEHIAIVDSISGSTLTTINGNGGGNKVTHSRRSYNSTVTIIEMKWDSASSPDEAKTLPKVFLNPGHGMGPSGYDPGACGNGYKEAETARDVVKGVENALKGYADVTVWDYNKDLYAYNPTDISWGEYEYFLSVHFNAGGGVGCEIYHPPGRASCKTDKLILEKVVSAGGFTNRGVKSASHKVTSMSDKCSRGGTTSALLEVCFIDSASDMQKYSANKDAISKGIAQAIISGLGLTYSDSGASTEKETYFTDTNEKVPLHPTLFTVDELFADDFAVYIGARNVTRSCGSISWTNSTGQLAVSFDIELAKSDARFTYLYQAVKGDIVRVYLGEERFRGVILAVDPSDKHKNKYTVVDAGWYLGKTKDTYQFSNMQADEAFRKICGDLGIPIVYLDDDLKLGTVSGVYIDKAISDVFSDFINQIGGKWNYDFVPSGFRVYRQGRFKAEPMFRTSENTAWRSSVEYRGNEQRKSSVEDMRNSVKVVSDTHVLKTVRDNNSYNNYGFLQEIVKIDPEKENAEAVAETKLYELNVETNTLSFDMQVQLSDYTRAGELLSVENESYYILSSKHTVKNKRHSVSVELERIEII